MENSLRLKSSISSIIMRSIGNYLFGIFKLIFSLMGLKKKKSEEDKWKTPPFIGLTDVFRPWHIEINIEQKMIISRRRNWYLIGFDEQHYLFNTVRQIFVDNKLFGADLYIRVYAGHVKAFSLSKKGAIKIRDLLLSNNNKSNTDITIDIDD